MKPITKEQRVAIKRLYDRSPIYKADKTAGELAYDAGWRYVLVTALPTGGLRERAMEAGYHHVWIHGNLSPVYQSADGIVTDYRLADRVTYRQFRKTVQQGFDCLMVRWKGMWLGIEKDGHTHS